MMMEASNDSITQQGLEANPANQAPDVREALAAVATAPTGEAARLALTKELMALPADSPQRAAKLEALRATLALQESPEERTARQESDQRDRYSVTDHEMLRHNKAWLETYNNDYRDWESDLFDHAHEHGLDGNQVRGLRDEAIRLGQQVADSGQSLSAEELTIVFNKLNIPAGSRPALIDLWRNVEGNV